MKNTFDTYKKLSYKCHLRGWLMKLRSSSKAVAINVIL